MAGAASRQCARASLSRPQPRSRRLTRSRESRTALGDLRAWLLLASALALPARHHTEAKSRLLAGEVRGQRRARSSRAARASVRRLACRRGVGVPDRCTGAARPEAQCRVERPSRTRTARTRWRSRRFPRPSEAIQTAPTEPLRLPDHRARCGTERSAWRSAFPRMTPMKGDPPMRKTLVRARCGALRQSCASHHPG